jgi:hypothetical protein
MSRINVAVYISGKIANMICKCGIQKWAFSRVPVVMKNGEEYEIIAAMNVVVCVLCERSYVIA